MTILEHMRGFCREYGRQTKVGPVTWQYYRLGEGQPILWLTGGLRRPALAFDAMQQLAAHHTVIALDYPPVRTMAEYIAGFDTILQAERMERVILAGQSYGGLLAQAYLAQRPVVVEDLVLSSSGPADYRKGWLPVEYAVIGLARILPQKLLMNLLGGGFKKAIHLPEEKQAEWLKAVDEILYRDLTRADVISHFGVAADFIRKGGIKPGAYRGWTGRVIVLTAENDPTQEKQDIPRYERLFGRPIRVVSMGNMGHTALLFDPQRYVNLLEQALHS